MKSIIMSDFHGKSPIPLVERLRKEEGINRAIFLGDYDCPSILKEILDYDIDKIILIGNHEYEFIHEHGVISAMLEMPSYKYTEWWRNSQNEKKFALDCSKIKQGRKRGIKVIKNIDGKKIVYVHGSLSRKSRPEKPAEVWGRMILTEDKIDNLKQMQKNNYWIMFRGHDHDSKILSIERKDNAENFKELYERGLQLDKDKIYIVNVGEFWSGDYVLFDDKTLKLEFKDYYGKRN